MQLFVYLLFAEKGVITALLQRRGGLAAKAGF